MAGDSGELQRLQRRLRTLALSRWVGIAFGGFQVIAYDQATYPDGLFAAACVIVLLMVPVNIGYELAHRNGAVRQSVDALRRVGLVGLGLDILIVSALVWVYAFDPVSALFAVLVLLPIEGALIAGPVGAAWSWAAVSVLYAGREWFGVRYGNPWELSSVTFRIGLIGIVTLVVALLVRDLTAEREVAAAARHEAERAAQWRSRLISLLAHDIRAPLATIANASAMIRDHGRELPDDTLRQMSEISVRQAERSMLLARDLLDVAQVEAGSLVLQPAPVRVADVVEAVTPLLPDDVDLRVDVPADLGIVADGPRLEQAVHNLLQNAVRHGRPPITVTASRVNDTEVRIEVRDHGPGVPADLDLFAPFAGQGAGSVGLGMWASRLIAEAHGGTLVHTDAAPGARFVLVLPPAAAGRGGEAPQT